MLAATGLATALTTGLAAGPARAAAPRDLAAELAAATAQVQALGDELDAAAAQDGGLRARLDDLAEEHERARDRLERRVREVWIAAPPPVAAGWRGVTDPGGDVLARAGATASVGVEAELVDGVAATAGQLRALRAQAGERADGLRASAAAVLGAQERARVLLVEAEREAAQAARDAALARAGRPAALLVGPDPLLTARSALAEAVRSVAAVPAPEPMPVQSARGRRSAEREAPLLALVEAAGSGYPAGWGPSGRVVVGTASWYGPGFVGSPTASGTPYDPERLTCAHVTLPLGTLLHVTSGGRAVNCLVNDRGPYVGDRVLDMSRAGSRALGYDGTAEVVAEVLVPRP